ncbi:MAG: hypothetical protein M1835_004736 [Candelina submexicana]|nr:MAG: hypothetical protein M1835_004736 [Candelina submexicana]
MAPAGDSIYFPSLDKCLSGEHQLISWKTALIALSNLDDVRSNSALQNFLSDQHTIDLLKLPFKCFQPPTPHTRTSFETRTAAIHVTPSAHGHYDINQIKEDTLWLSKEVQVEEVAALRIVILEWQTRPATQLLSGFSEEESARVQDATGSNAFGLSQLRSSVQIPPSQRPDSTSFDGLDSRRLRFWDIYLSERRYILKVSEVLVSASLDLEAAGQLHLRSDKGKKQEKSTWVSQVGAAIVEQQRSSKDGAGSANTFLGECVKSLQVHIDDLEGGSGSFKGEGGRPEIEESWCQNQITEMIHVMELMFITIDFSADISPSAITLSWLRFAGKYGFFDQFQPPFPSQQSLLLPFQALIAMISLVVLKLPLTTAHLFDSAEQPPHATDVSDLAPYINNMATIVEINSLLSDAAAASLTTASPAVFAWSVIMQVLREVSRARQEAREIRQSQRAVDGFQAASSLENETVDSTPIENRSLYPSLRRRSTNSETSLEPTMYEESLEKIMENSLDGDPIAYLARSAVDGSRVFDVISSLAGEVCIAFGSDRKPGLRLRIRIALLELVRSSLSLIEYLPEVLQAALAVLSGSERYWDFVGRPAIASGLDPTAMFLDDDFMVQKLLFTALSRFPYETLPFLKLCKALAACRTTNDEGTLLIYELLENLGTFTQLLPLSFRGYGAIREDENANYVSLKENLSLFFERKGRLASQRHGPAQHNALVNIKGNDSTGGLYIPAGTVGRVISETKPLIVVWDYKYSGLKYLGRLLETALVGSNLTAYASGLESDRDTLTEIVGLLTVLLRSSVESARTEGEGLAGVEAAHRVLEEASDGLDRNRDIITIVFDIFDEELHQKPSHPGLEHSMDLLVHCVQFIHALIPILPSRVWQLLAKGGLLEIDGRAGKLASVVEASEMIAGHYDFLIGCVCIFQGLVEDAATHSVARKVATSKVASRFTEIEARVAGIPDKTMMKVLLAYERTMVAVIESSPTWVFTNPEERLEISTRLMSTFHNILQYSHSIDDSPDPTKKIFAVFTPAANYLIDVFLSISSNDLPSHTILRIFYQGIETPHSTVLLSKLDIWTAYVRTALDYATLLIQISTYLELPTSHLESQLFKATPLLVRLYVSHEIYQVPVICVLRAIIISAASSSEEPPSLLGHFGQETAKNFLSVLSVLNSPLNDEPLNVSIWNLLSAIVSSRQQWFAIYLLTGSTPRESLKDTKRATVSSTRGRPLLIVALDSLADITALQPERALAMLEFVALAEDNWPWAMTDLHKHPKFLTAISDFIDTLNSRPTPKDSVKECNRTRMASYIADILAMYIHHSRQLGETSFATKLVTKLAYFTNNAATVPGYNSSLHGNLQRNFGMKFPGCDLNSFKRTKLQRQPFGRDYFYNLDLLNQVMQYDPAWSGTRDQGFAEEVARANINLSTIESQVFLLHSWKLFIIELSAVLAQELGLQRVMARVISDCLNSNAKSTLPETIFKRLAQVRADLAFVLMQRLVEVKSKETEVKAILPEIWDTLRTCGATFELSTTSNDISYYRCLLKVLFLALQVYTVDSQEAKSTASTNGITPTPAKQPKRANAPESSYIILDILGVVVAQGFRSLATRLHDHPEESSATDFALLTAILQTAIRIPEVDKSQSQIVLQFAENKIARYATTLFSWADQLAVNADPVYGELSILFILELSAMPMMAEHLAVEGVLSQLSNANIMGRFRNANGVGPFDDQPRLYAIWTRGILPLCLNLLDSVGAAIGGEIAAFLNQFPRQLARSADGFDSKRAPTPTDPSAGCLTLAAASEAHSLALISHILDSFRAAGASMGVVPAEISELKWDRGQVKEDVEGWLQERRVLRERILPVTEREVELVRQEALDTRVGAENRLEEKVVTELAGAFRCLGSANNQ